MTRWMKTTLTFATALALGGCVFAAGTGGDSGKRIRRLEQRMAKAEKQLGIEAVEEEKR